MRAFIAIELPQDIKTYLARIQDRLKTAGADVKWVEPKNIHLTLKFLGEIEEEKLNQICAIIKKIASCGNSFDMQISSVGAFPKISYPRVIWIGIEKGSEQIKEIAQNLENSLLSLGFQKENRPFSSHVTIGRLRSSLNKAKLIQALTELVGNSSANNPEFTVTKLTLFKSTLTPKGPIYEVLKETLLTSQR